MVDLIAADPFDGALPVAFEGVTLSAVEIGRATSIAPFRGREKEVATALNAALGFGFPAPGRMVSKSGARALWIGRGQALLIGAEAPELAGRAAVTDQTDGFAVLRVEGAWAEAVLARHVPVDLRAGTFKRGHTARTTIGHITGSVTRVGANAFEVMCMRSMAGSLAHELTLAARAVAGRAAL